MTSTQDQVSAEGLAVGKTPADQLSAEGTAALDQLYADFGAAHVTPLGPSGPG